MRRNRGIRFERSPETERAYKMLKKHLDGGSDKIRYFLQWIQYLASDYTILATALSREGATAREIDYAKRCSSAASRVSIALQNFNKETYSP